MKLHRESTGRYYFKNKNGETVHIYKIETRLWGYCIGRGMTKKTFNSLKEAKKVLM